MVVEGAEQPLHSCCHRILGDRIAAATYLAAAAATGGDVFLRDIDYRHLSTVTGVLRQAGCGLVCRDDGIRLTSDGHLRAVSPIRTAPYPGFPTDAQAVLMASLLRSSGTTVFVENIFESRYHHVPELVRMGADIRLEGRVAVVCGVDRLQAARVRAMDLRGGAALVIAGLQAHGVTTVEHLHHIRRGYSDLPGDLALLGAHIFGMFFKHLARYFLFTVRRQTMHNKSVFIGKSHYCIIYLITLKRFFTLLSFAFLTHGSPYVCKNDISIFSCFFRVVSNCKAVKICCKIHYFLSPR